MKWKGYVVQSLIVGIALSTSLTAYTCTLDTIKRKITEIFYPEIHQAQKEATVVFEKAFSDFQLSLELYESNKINTEIEILSAVRNYMNIKQYNQAIWKIQSNAISIETDKLESALALYLSQGRILKTERLGTRGRRRIYLAYFENGMKGILKSPSNASVANSEISHYGVSQFFSTFYVPISATRLHGKWKNYTSQLYLEGDTLHKLRKLYLEKDGLIFNYQKIYDQPLNLVMIYNYFTADSDGDMSNYFAWEKGRISVIDGDLTFNRYHGSFSKHKEYFVELPEKLKEKLIEEVRLITYSTLERKMQGTPKLYIDNTWERIQNFLNATE